MPSKTGITTYLGSKDKELFDKAVNLRKTKKSKLAKEIISRWLFDNKFSIESLEVFENVVKKKEK
ncbi:hypothetical protein HYV80_05765 [Candidatus Woesearchaeota archaeon]|nr:hypothetical protein [Candidatus Woesearchaeota archaeon]